MRSDVVMDGETRAGESDALLAGSEWRLVRLADLEGALRPALADVPVTAFFGEDGRVAGSGGCNRYFARYAVDGATLSVSAAGCTMMACAPRILAQEARFLALLGAAETFDIVRDRLLVRGADDATCLEFERLSPEDESA